MTFLLHRFVCAGIFACVVLGTNNLFFALIHGQFSLALNTSKNITMAKHFENHMEEFGTAKSKAYLNTDLNDISTDFRNTIQSYINNKTRDLLKEKQEIFSSGCVYTGSAGIALLLYQRAKYSQDPSRDDALREALSYVEGGKGRSDKAPSFLCGAAGPLALGTVLTYHLGLPHTDYLRRLEALMQLAENPTTPDELLYGRAGYLFALLFVNRETGQQIIAPKNINKVVQLILESGRARASREGVAKDCPLLYRWHDSAYLGAAHGTAGILHLLLQAEAPSPTELVDTLDWLLRQRYPTGNLQSSLGSKGDRLVQWCHGAPGLVQPLLLAHQVYGEDRHFQGALQCGRVVWERGLCTKGYSICHGVAGNAYTFLHLYQATREPQWLYRAARFAEWCMEELEGTEQHAPDRPASLFEGLAGRLYFLNDMLHHQTAKFPAYSV